MKIKEYVLGFLFNGSRTSVVLIRKNKPDWQRGFLNGVGGSIEKGESPIAAMRREAKEEANVSPDWQQFATMDGSGWIVYCFRAFDSAAHTNADTRTSEAIEKVGIYQLRENPTISNVPWLVHAALDDNHGQPMNLKIRYAKYPSPFMMTNEPTPPIEEGRMKTAKEWIDSQNGLHTTEAVALLWIEQIQRDSISAKQKEIEGLKEEVERWKTIAKSH